MKKEFSQLGGKMSDMKKVVVIGNNGVGKSVFSEKLGEILNIPVVHLDKYFHRDDGSTLNNLEWDKKHSKLMKGSSWIMDGTYPRTLSTRLKVADTIIFLNYPKLLAFYHAVRRRTIEGEARLYSKKSYFRLLKKIVIFSKSRILIKLKGLKNNQKIITLSSRKDASKLLSTL